MKFSVYCGGTQSLHTQSVNLIARRRTILRRFVVKNLPSNSDLVSNKILIDKILNKVLSYLATVEHGMKTSNIKSGCVYWEIS